MKKFVEVTLTLEWGYVGLEESGRVVMGRCQVRRSGGCLCQ